MSSFKLSHVQKDGRKIVKALIDQGWEAKHTGGGHIKLTKAGHQQIVIACSNSDHRWVKNLVRDARSVGVCV